MLFHALDAPGAGALRKRLTPDNLAYLEANRDAVMARGPLLSDDGETQIGSVFLFDVADLAAGLELRRNMPFEKGGLYEDVVFHRWRFGRAFGR